MAGEFEIVRSDIYDEVTLDESGRPIATKPFTDVATGKVFSKYVLFEIKADEGTYPVTVKIDLPDGRVEMLGSRSITVREGINAVVTSRIRLDRPMPGFHKITILIADRTVGALDIDIKKE